MFLDLMAANIYKKAATGLTGVAVQPKAHDRLKLLYNKTLMHLNNYPKVKSTHFEIHSFSSSILGLDLITV